MAGFSAYVSAEVAKRKLLLEAVRKEAAQRTVTIMQTPVAKGGNMPVKTGFLRASLKAAIGQVAFSGAIRPSRDKTYSWDGSQVNFTIAGADISDPIVVVYTAVYARRANYGDDKRPARQFVGLAAQQWPRIVNEVCKEAEQRILKS